MQRTPEIEAYWTAFRKAAGIAHDLYVVVQMGESPALADELLDLMLAGRKRATASLARDYEGDEPLPRVGDYVVVVDSTDAPRCIWRTTEVSIKPLIEVDDAFAWDEARATARAPFGWTRIAASLRARPPVKASRCMIGSRPCASGLRCSARQRRRTEVFG